MAEGQVADELIYRVSIHMLWQQQYMQFGFHLRDAGIESTTPVEAAQAAWDWCNASVRPKVSDTMRFERVEALELTSKNYGQVELLNMIGGTAATFTTAPSYTACVVALRSAQRARHRNGRFFVPITTQSAMDGSRLSAAALVGMAAIASDFATAFTGSEISSTFKAVNVAQPRPANQHRPAITHSWIDVDTVRLNTQLTALRRRKVGVGS